MLSCCEFWSKMLKGISLRLIAWRNPIAFCEMTRCKCITSHIWTFRFFICIHSDSNEAIILGFVFTFDHLIDSAKIITFIRIFAHFCMNLTDLNKLTFERTFDSRCTYWTSWTDNSDGNLSVFVAPQCMLLGSNSLHVGDFRCIFCQNPDFNSSFLTGGYKDSAQTPSAPIPSKKLEKFQINVFLFPFFV